LSIDQSQTNSLRYSTTALLPEKESQEVRKRRSDLLRRTIEGMPEFIRKMPLVELSRVGALMYSEDFRRGRTLFSKGALMAGLGRPPAACSCHLLVPPGPDPPKDRREEATARFVSRDGELGREVGTRVSSR
jgi:hypothetical protein